MTTHEIIVSVLRKHLISRKIAEQIANEIITESDAKTRTKTAFVSKRNWGPDDDYLVVEFQVFEEDGFHANQEVEVRICPKKQRGKIKV
jgi:hypothetical protein